MVEARGDLEAWEVGHPCQGLQGDSGARAGRVRADSREEGNVKDSVRQTLAVDISSTVTV